MTSEGLGEMFECDSADTCGIKFPLVLMVGRAEGLACADPGARTPIGASRNFLVLCFTCKGCENIFVLNNMLNMIDVCIARTSVSAKGGPHIRVWSITSIIHKQTKKTLIVATTFCRNGKGQPPHTARTNSSH